ncbi:GspE/PulE family protein [Shewanella xiamenensis]|uniref:GspE/PulE family protein n=1 Tax=Shewanella xiamenensis TaxID=332186 RepID=UPI002E7ACDA7|nr:ATPase, T2SS/T4P/T4SS family [Shewanella xiamenensis]MEE1981518.1 ATPase, T2SS/T4P/T4SS family [Shewanella xiamenensis]
MFINWKNLWGNLFRKNVNNNPSTPQQTTVDAEIIVSPKLKMWYYQGRNVIALTNGTIITSDLHAEKLSDIREYIRTSPDICGGKFYGQLLPVKLTTPEIIEQRLEESSLLLDQKTEKLVDTEVAQHLTELMQKAVNLGSSDIHIELYEAETQFFARVDGRRVYLQNTIPLHAVGLRLFGYIFTSEAVDKDDDFFVKKINNGKIEKLLDCPTEDGRTERRETLWRAAYIPTKGGGKLTMRWVNANKKIPPLNKMGLEPAHIAMLTAFCEGNSGLMIMAGKTGSGKSTLIAALLKLFGKDRSLHSLEDPPEFDNGIPQTHVTPSQKKGGDELLGFGFYSKALLRHDVDVELHGEVRDHAGAMEVTRKGETGQIMFTTLHTSSAVGIGHTLTEQLHVPVAVVAAPDLMRVWAYQTLVRTLCDHCKMSEDSARAFYKENAMEGIFETKLTHTVALVGESQRQKVRYLNPQGCPHCTEGEKGRTALFEIIALDDEDRGFIQRKDYLGWNTALRNKGFKTVRDHAIHKILLGMIDIDTASRKVANLIPVATKTIYAQLNYEEADIPHVLTHPKPELKVL